MITEKKLNYLHRKALAIASASHDPHTQVGAILFDKDTHATISEGYNGYVRGADDDNLPKTRPEKYDYIIHAEKNMIANATRHGKGTNNAAVYCTISPCIHCMRFLYQCGVDEIYVKGFYSDFEKCSSMLDLQMSVTSIGEFSRISINPRKANGN